MAISLDEFRNRSRNDSNVLLLRKEKLLHQNWLEQIVSWINPLTMIPMVIRWLNGDSRRDNREVMEAFVQSIRNKHSGLCTSWIADEAEQMIGKIQENSQPLTGYSVRQILGYTDRLERNYHHNWKFYTVLFVGSGTDSKPTFSQKLLEVCDSLNISEKSVSGETRHLIEVDFIQDLSRHSYLQMEEKHAEALISWKIKKHLLPQYGKTLSCHTQSALGKLENFSDPSALVDPLADMAKSLETAMVEMRLTEAEKRVCVEELAHANLDQYTREEKTALYHRSVSNAAVDLRGWLTRDTPFQPIATKEAMTFNRGTIMLDCLNQITRQLGRAAGENVDEMEKKLNQPQPMLFRKNRNTNMAQKLLKQDALVHNSTTLALLGSHSLVTRIQQDFQSPSVESKPNITSVLDSNSHSYSISRDFSDTRNRNITLIKGKRHDSFQDMQPPDNVSQKIRKLVEFCDENENLALFVSQYANVTSIQSVANRLLTDDQWVPEMVFPGDSVHFSPIGSPNSHITLTDEKEQGIRMDIRADYSPLKQIFFTGNSECLNLEPSSRFSFRFSVRLPKNGEKNQISLSGPIWFSYSLLLPESQSDGNTRAAIRNL